jgi:hypothetical protein
MFRGVLALWIKLDLIHTTAFCTDGILYLMAFALKVPETSNSQFIIFHILGTVVRDNPYIMAKVRNALWSEMMQRNWIPIPSLPLVEAMIQTRTHIPANVVITLRKRISESWPDTVKGMLKHYDSSGYMLGPIIDADGTVQDDSRQYTEGTAVWVTSNHALRRTA